MAPPPEPHPAAPPPPRPVWHPLVRSVLYIGAFFLTQIVLTVGLSAVAYLVAPGFVEEGGFGASSEAFLMTVALSALPVLFVTWLFVRFLDRRGMASIGVRWPDGGKGAALRQTFSASLAVFALLGIWLGILVALPETIAQVWFEGLSPRFSEGPGWWPLPSPLLLGVLLIGFLLQGGFEELTVRGYIYRAFKERWRPWVSALASSVLFSLLHAQNPSVTWVALVNIVIAGMVLASLVERTGSLWSAVIAHGVWNWAVACVYSLPVSGIDIFHLLDIDVTGNTTLTGGGFGPEGSLLLTVLGLLLAVWLWRGVPERNLQTETAVSAPEDRPPLPPQGEGPVQSLQ